MQKEGYEGLSEDMQTMLEDTEYEIIHSAEKQQSVISNMLNNVVTNYKDAFGQINSIIANTGWVGSTDFNSNQSQLSTQAGASTQTSNATKNQSSTSSSSTANSTKTSGINNDDSSHKATEAELAKPENTLNRPVAELKLSTNAITLEEGKSTSVSVSIRPTDAANKNLSWKTNNVQIATVSSGTIKALKPGSCQITAITTDGSGISASVTVTVTKKPEPPKPQPTPQKPKTGGDGIPRVGDVATLKLGEMYYYDSWGATPAGNLYNGYANGVVIDDYSSTEFGGQSGFHGDYSVHIKSADGRFGDLGWVRLDQLQGYNTGGRNIPKGLAKFDEDENGNLDIGSEVIATKHGVLAKMGGGETVFNKAQVDALYQLSQGNVGGLLNNMDVVPKAISAMQNIDNRKTESVVNVHYDSLLTVEGNVDKDALPGLKDILEKSYNYTADKLYKDAGKVGAKIRRGSR